MRMLTAERRRQRCMFVGGYRAELIHRDWSMTAAWEWELGVPAQLGSSRNALRVSTAWQDCRIAQQRRHAFGLFCWHAGRLMADLDATRSMARQMKRAILPLLHAGEVTAAPVALVLGLSRHGLCRALL